MNLPIADIGPSTKVNSNTFVARAASTNRLLTPGRAGPDSLRPDGAGSATVSVVNTGTGLGNIAFHSTKVLQPPLAVAFLAGVSTQTAETGAGCGRDHSEPPPTHSRLQPWADSLGPVDRPSRPPSVDQLARSLRRHGLPHPLLVEVARQAIDEGRVDQADELARARRRRLLTPVVNATGVLLHTNLGRAPLGIEVEAAYTNLELSLETGQRGSRQRAVGDLVATAAGAEAAMVVNNCAGAVLLTLAALGAGRGVAVSRGEMVEIGGGFRIPDVMRQSGARLVEVGTTNRTRLADYAAVADPDAAAEAGTGSELAMVLKVHRSNYEIVGFTEEVSIAALATLDVPLVADIGSGLLDASCPWLSGPPPAWLANEPAARQSLDAGADLVLFSGDKLFGGPQAGIIAGSRELVEACGRHPLARALRPGDLVLTAIQAVTTAYLDRRGDDIPFWRMATVAVDTLAARADKIVSTVGSDQVSSQPTEAVPGGGTLPTVTFPSHGLVVNTDVSEALRELERPVIARVDQGRTLLDLRTVDDTDDDGLAEALASILGSGPPADRHDRSDEGKA